MDKKIYLAIPYSHPDPKERDTRAKVADRICAHLFKEGFLVFSPISHCHHIKVGYDLPGDFKFWEKLDKSFIDWADEVWVIKYPGWKESVGVTAEIKYALETGKPINYIEYKKQDDGYLFSYVVVDEDNYERIS